MCFPPEASPPRVPADLLANQDRPTATDVELRAQDGASFGAAIARAAEVRGPSVLILPDVRGLFGFYRQLAREFAAAGHSAAVLDYFGRTALHLPRTSDFDFLPHVRRTTLEQVQDDATTLAETLRSVTGTSRVVTVGFCFGGSHSYLASANPALAPAATVSFYGGLDETRLGVFPRPAKEAPKLTGPLLGIFGGSDSSIPPELVEEFDLALTQSHIDHEFVTYPNAPHSFFDRTHQTHTAECIDAWRRTLGFIRSIAGGRQ